VHSVRSPKLPLRRRRDRRHLAPAWVAYLTGHLYQAGFDDIHFIDAMTDDVSDADLAKK